MKLTSLPHRLTGTVNAQGRVVIPVGVREALGLRAGDVVDFVLETGGVRLVTARLAAQAVWANNTGGDGGDSTADMRAERARDRKLEAAGAERGTVGPEQDVDLTASDLLAQLGVA